MRSRRVALAGSLAALALAATPVAAVAATTHHGSAAASTDRSRDARGVRHFDRSPDRSSMDRRADTRDW